MKINSNEIKGIIFDLDGTLFDSCDMWHQIDVEFFKKRNLEFPSDYSEAIAHLGLKKAASYTKNRFNLIETEEELIKEWNDGAIYQYTHNVLLKPFVKKFLDKVKNEGIKLSVATANSSEYYMPCLKRNAILDYFDIIHDVSKTKEGKDNPEIYMYIANEFGFKPSEMVVFEDIPMALSTAKKAGFNTVAVDDVSEAKYINEKKKLSDIFIKSFEELL